MGRRIPGLPIGGTTTDQAVPSILQGVSHVIWHRSIRRVRYFNRLAGHSESEITVIFSLQFKITDVERFQSLADRSELLPHRGMCSATLRELLRLGIHNPETKQEIDPELICKLTGILYAS